MAALLPFGKAPFGKSHSSQPNKAFISTKAFNGEFFSYSTSYNSSTFTTVGSLVLNPSATALLCPSGRVLHANGKFLKTGVHPDLSYSGTSYTFLVGVYDPVTFLNGYINAASSTFAPYDANMPYFDDDGTGVTNPALGGSQGKALFGPDAGQLTQSGTGSVDAGNGVTGRVTLSSSATSVQVLSTAVTATSRIFVTPCSDITGAVGEVPYVSAIGSGTFTVDSAVSESFYFLVVN